MDQLCEPLEVNRKFIKMIEETIKPEYDKVLQEIWKQLKEDIDKTYYITVKSINDESSNVSYS
tara:strand:+ start:568 stop:756 length:189 start_codon:yes stop_codon:yes gene_type:complete